jgi:hypothetical protein
MKYLIFTLLISITTQAQQADDPAKLLEDLVVFTSNNYESVMTPYNELINGCPRPKRSLEIYDFVKKFPWQQMQKLNQRQLLIDTYSLKRTKPQLQAVMKFEEINRYLLDVKIDIASCLLDDRVQVSLPMRLELERVFAEAFQDETL